MLNRISQRGMMPPKPSSQEPQFTRVVAVFWPSTVAWKMGSHEPSLNSEVTFTRW